MFNLDDTEGVCDFFDVPILSSLSTDLQWTVMEKIVAGLYISFSQNKEQTSTMIFLCAKWKLLLWNVFESNVWLNDSSALYDQVVMKGWTNQSLVWDETTLGFQQQIVLMIHF